MKHWGWQPIDEQQRVHDLHMQRIGLCRISHKLKESRQKYMDDTLRKMDACEEDDYHGHALFGGARLFSDGTSSSSKHTAVVENYFNSLLIGFSVEEFLIVRSLINRILRNEMHHHATTHRETLSRTSP
jgi:hypothetical protein